MEKDDFVDTVNQTSITQSEKDLHEKRDKNYQKAIFKRKIKQAKVTELFDRTNDDKEIDEVLSKIKH